MTAPRAYTLTLKAHMWLDRFGGLDENVTPKISRKFKRSRGMCRGCFRYMPVLDDRRIGEAHFDGAGKPCRGYGELALKPGGES